MGAIYSVQHSLHKGEDGVECAKVFTGAAYSVLGWCLTGSTQDSGKGGI